MSTQEEHDYVVSFHDHGNFNAAHVLVVANLRGVLHVAWQYSGYGLPYMDLVQEGCDGLMRTAKCYNPQRQVRLFAYALPGIKSEIQRYIQDRSSTLSALAAQYSISFERVRQIKKAVVHKLKTALSYFDDGATA